MPHVHGPNEPHVTTTFGTRDIQPRIVGMVLRLKPTRGTADSEEQSRVWALMERWVSRYCTRRDIGWTNLNVSAVGGNIGEPPDALAVSFFAIEVPADWLCFVSLIARPILPSVMPALVPLPSFLGFLEGEDEPADVAEAEIGGEKVVIGSQKRTTN